MIHETLVRLKTAAFTPTLVIAFVAVFAMVMLFFSQRSLLYPMPNDPLPAVLPANVDLVELDEGHALFVRARRSGNEPAPVLIYTHGNAATAHQNIERLAYFTQNGIHVLLVEYPGYAASKGSPSSDSIERTTLEAYDRAMTRPEVNASFVAIYGRSIGGGPACFLASQRPAAALILESTFTSLSSLVTEKGFPSMLLRDRFDNDAIVAQLDMPMLIYHGTRDTLIPFHHGRRLHDIATGSTLISRACGHNDCRRPWPEVLRFLQSKWDWQPRGYDASSR